MTPIVTDAELAEVQAILDEYGITREAVDRPIYEAAKSWLPHLPAEQPEAVVLPFRRRR